MPLRPRHNTARAKYDRLLPLILAAESEVRASLARVLGDLEARAGQTTMIDGELVLRERMAGKSVRVIARELRCTVDEVNATSTN